MTKDEALKMAIDELMKALKLLQRFEPQIVGDNITAWTVGLRNQLSDLQHTLYNNGLVETIKACKEALEQPLTRDWKETIDERIAKDDEFKRALEQPSVAELNDEYLRDTYVQGLSQPAQEPVAIVYSMQDGYIGQMVVKDIPHKTKLYTHPAPSWQGLSDDEILEIDKSIDPEISIGKGKTLFARAIEQASKDKNHD